MKVVAYQACLPKRNNKTEKIDALRNFCQGVTALGDQAILHTDMNIVDCDVAVILGWVHADSKNSPHLNFRRHVIKEQESWGRKVVVIDSSLFLYKDTDNPHHYLRYSFNGVFPNTGIYCDDRPHPRRWDSVSKTLRINLKPYRDNGTHILICLQRNGGWSMDSIDVVSWLDCTIQQIRLVSDRPIVVRPHPGDGQSKVYLDAFSKTKPHGVSISTSSDLLDDLRGCWAVVNHNSSPTVAAAIEGYPIFVTDPDRSQCRDIANTDLSQIENPTLFDRQHWAERISMFHWNFRELKTGQCWNHMRKYVQSSTK